MKTVNNILWAIVLICLVILTVVSLLIGNYVFTITFGLGIIAWTFALDSIYKYVK